VPVAVALLTFLAFLPSLRGQFLGWDDDVNFVGNPHYRGLGWSELRWMFTTGHMGHYIPVTWVTLGLDYLVWGMDPTGYHLTNLLLHAANAVLAYAIALYLLRHAMPAPAGERPWRQRAGAAAAALSFAVHPLRVESVAWITERRDVLSAFFYLLALLAYLRACAARAEEDAPRVFRWYWTSVGSFALALLSKSMAVTLPAVLLIIDAYPLGRLRLGDGLGAARRVLIEKLPFVALALIASAVALGVLIGSGLQTPVTRLDWPGRIMISLYNPAFYLWKTLVPTGLLPFYELPEPFKAFAPPLLAGGLATVAISGLAFALRRRWPGFLATWAAFIVMLLPVIGIVHNGYQIVADRYTYLPCLGWALLGGWALVRAGELSGDRLGGRLRAAVAAAAVVLLVILGALTWRQTRIWHDTESLWRPVLAVRPSPIALLSLGVSEYHQGRYTEGIDHLQRALALRPAYPEANFNLGRIFQAQGRVAEAVESYRRALELRPDMNVVAATLGDLFLSQHRWIEAEEQFRDLLRRDPEFSEAHNSLGVVLYRQDRAEESLRHYRKAIDLRPGYAEARYNLGNALMRLGRWREAAEQLQQAVSLNPDLPDFHNSLGVTLAQQGKVGEAIEHFQAALRLDPGNDEARANLRIAMSQQTGAPGRR
jgi:tetratricopeptide (TPR) repeat protein